MSSQKKNDGREMERVVQANGGTANAQFKYADNYVRTSKYNLLTFLPLNLLQQFKRAANLYFLFLIGLQTVSYISSVGWFSTAVPLFFVLSFSAVKDAYDDIQRHRSDSQVNNRVVYIVRDGRLEEEKWMNVSGA